MDFKSLGISSFLTNALNEKGISKPYPIQSQTIPKVLEGKDVMGIGPTGSGKTISYVLPLLMKVDGKSPLRNRHIQALILVPTRELAIQVGDVVKAYANFLPNHIKCMAVYGGVSINPQMKGLQNVNILVATPGRLLELAESNALHLTSTKFLVIDEADKMLNLGFKEEMDKIFRKLPSRRQNLLFSATLSPDIEGIKNVLLDNPEIIEIIPEETSVDLIKQTAYYVVNEQKGPLLRYLIKTKEMKQVLIFTSSTFKADNVAKKLRKNGISAESIHGKKSQGRRKINLENFISGALPVLVTTDLLSRGIDIAFLPYVINYELPRSPKDFIHRIGRTGRAENPGEAITFLQQAEEPHFYVIQKKMGKRVPILHAESIDLMGY